MHVQAQAQGRAGADTRVMYPLLSVLPYYPYPIPYKYIYISRT